MKALITFLLLFMQGPQQAPNLLPLQEQALVEGVVRRAGTTDPVPRARVVLLSSPAPGNLTTVTADEMGRFAFRNVAPGRYTLVATRDGYVRGSYGQRGPNSTGAVMTLAASQAFRGVVVDMTPTGAIAGRIANGFGEPASNVAVQAHRAVFQAGRRALSLVQTARTNDLGEYRLYFLPPGRYVVSATPSEGPRQLQASSAILTVEILPGSPISTASPSTITGPAAMINGAGLVSTADTGMAYLPAYYPGTTDSSLALPMEVHAGRTSIVDLTVSEVRAVRVRGQVLNSATGQPASGASVLLMAPSTTGSPTTSRTVTTAANGTFEFRGIAPGLYEIVAAIGSSPTGPFAAAGIPGVSISRGAPPAAMIVPPGTEPRLAARMQLPVGTTDVENIGLSLQPGYNLSGRITIEGRTMAESAAILSGATIQLQSDLGITQAHAMPAAIEPNGEFTIRGLLPGTYQIGIMRATAVPTNAYVKSGRMGITDVLNPRLRIEGEPREVLELVIATNPGTLDAVVLDEKLMPAAGVTILLIPDFLRAQHYDLYLRLSTDDAGRAHLDNIPPGDYTAYAWEDIETGAWWDPEFMQKYQGRGKAVHVDEGGKHIVTLNSIPWLASQIR